VPNENLRFESHDEAYRFYCYYTKMAGHGVRITKTHPEVGEFNCNKQGGNRNFTNQGKRGKQRRYHRRHVARLL
jgi:hypothetical protein